MRRLWWYDMRWFALEYDRLVLKGVPVPKLPEGSPFQDFFDQFFNQKGDQDNQPRRVQSLGSGFVIKKPQAAMIIPGVQ